MSSLALIVRRARAGLGLLLTILALVTATTAIIAGTIGYSGAAATVAARQAITGTDTPVEAGVRVQTRQGEDPQAQDDTARRLIGDAFAPAPVRIERTLASESRPVQDHDERLQAIAGQTLTPDDPGFATLVEVVEGVWPAPGGNPTPGGTPTQGALHTGAAETWDLALGETVVIGGHEVQVTALWRPVDPDAADWFGDPLLAAGSADNIVGPLVVDPADISAFTEPPFVRWTVQPDTEELEPADLAPLAQAAQTLRSTLKTPTVEVRGITVDGDLAPTAARAARNLDTAKALNVVPLMVLFAVCLIAVVQLARLLAAARSGQLELFLARGASRRQVVGWSVVEAVVVSVAGATLGIAVALGVLRAVPAGAAQTQGVVTNGVLTGSAVLLALLTVTVLQVRSIADRRAADRSGRTRVASALATLVFVVGAAALAWWQLRRYGSPLVTDADGTLSTDLVAGAAPALLLAAVAVVALAVLGPLTRVLEHLTRSGRRLGAHLPAAQVSRRLVVYAVPVVLTVLAVGATTLSGLYAATSADLRGGLSSLELGADVRAVLESRPVAGQAGRIAALPPVAEVEGVEDIAPVWSMRTDIGETDTLLVAAPLDALGKVAVVPDGAADPADLLDTLGRERDQGTPVSIPAGVDSIDVEAELQTSLSPESLRDLGQEIERHARFLEDEIGMSSAEALENAERDVLGAGLANSQLEVTLRVQDLDSGAEQRVAAGALPFGMELTRGGQGELTVTPRTEKSSVTIPVPAGTAYQVVGIEVELAQVHPDVETTLDLMVVVDGNREPGTENAASWFADLPVDVPPPTLAPRADGGLTLTATASNGVLDGAGTSTVPLTPLESPDGPLPLAITRPVAEANSLAVGSPVDLRAYGTAVPAEVAAVVEAIPGSLTSDVALADAGALSNALAAQHEVLPDPAEVWISGQDTDPRVLAEAVAGVPGIEAATGRSAVAVTDSAAAVRLVFWVASAGSVLLAVTGIAAVAATLLSTRRSEVAVLRALGMPAGAQARARAAELAGVVLAAVLVGLSAGWLVGAAVIPELARSTTAPGQASLPAALRLETGPWLVLLGTGAVAVVALVVVLAGRVRVQARDATYREEVR